MSSIPRIAIVGAGPAGLTLARLLHVSQANLSITIFERDESPTSRTEQGGTLDLHADTGLAAIKACNLWDEFQIKARYQGEEMIIASHRGVELIHLREGQNRPEIGRRDLRRLLLESIPLEWIEWGSRIKRVTDDRRLEFHGHECLSEPFDLIVGADGAWSKVRHQLQSVEPAYAGVSGYELDIPNPAKTCPHVDEMVGQGGFISLYSGKLLNAQRLSDDSLKVRSWFTCPEGEAKERLEKDGQQATLERIKARHAAWSPDILELLVQADVETLRCWTLYELPVGNRWNHNPGFTLIGDAASLATPFSGEGVNKAMKDAVELARLIGQSQAVYGGMSLIEAVQQYELEMFPRAKELQTKTMGNKRAMFSAETVVDVVPLMVATLAGGSRSALVRVIGTSSVTLVLVRALCWMWLHIASIVKRYRAIRAN